MKRFIIGLIIGYVLGTFIFADEAQALLPTHECNFCHGVHHAPTPNVQLRWYSNIEQGCMSCHDGSGAVEVATHNDRGQQLATCIECHEVHDNLDNYLGGTNIKMVGFQYPAGGDNEATVVDNDGGTGAHKVAYESDTGNRAFANHDADMPNGKRICEVCHNIPNWGPHSNPTNTNNNCKNCHLHVDGWMR